MPPQPPAPTPTRIRSQDKVISTDELKVHLKSCRQTARIGNTLFRCNVRDNHGTVAAHEETGIVIDQQTGESFEYHITWHHQQRKVIRSATKQPIRSTTSKPTDDSATG